MLVKSWLLDFLTPSTEFRNNGIFIYYQPILSVAGCMHHVMFQLLQTVSTIHQVSAIPQFSVVSYCYLHDVSNIVLGAF